MLNELNIPAYIDVAAIRAAYAPYDRFAEFQIGFVDAMRARRAATNMGSGIAAQGYDRGYEAGCKIRRQAHWIERNVGAN